MIDDWDLKEICSFLKDNFTEIDKIIDLCESYVENKDAYMPHLKKLIKIKEQLKKQKLFTNNQKKGKKKGNRNSWIEGIKMFWDVGNIEMAKHQISFAFTDIRVFHSKTTLWRFRNDLKDLGIPESVILECKQFY